MFQSKRLAILSSIAILIGSMWSLSKHAKLARAQQSDGEASAIQHASENVPSSSQPGSDASKWHDSVVLSAVGIPGKPGTVMGVHVSHLSEPLRNHLKLADGFGLMVEHVDAGSAAATAGLRRYDVLVRFDDQELVNREQLSALVRCRSEGETVSLTIYRKGESIQVPVTLKTGTVLDHAANQWELHALGQTELKQHIHDPKFSQCQSCHSAANFHEVFDSFPHDQHVSDPRFHKCTNCHSEPAADHPAY